MNEYEQFLLPERAEIIRANTVEDGDCLRWTGACCNGHPGMRGENGKTVLVRRELWQAKHGPIPAGKILRCTCGTPKCVQIEHCTLTTYKRLALQLGAIGVMSGPVRSAKIAAAKRAGKQAKVTQEDVRAIRASDEPVAVLAGRYGVAEATISKYRLGQMRREFEANPWQGLGA